MMAVIGWIATALVGAYFVFLAVVRIFDAMNMGPEGLGALPLMLASGFIASIIWVVIIVWLSPLTIGWK